jgi:formate dehydrogenase subunit beta
MFHMTRLAHIGHACVACGHCTSVCPSSIPVADFFITVGSKVQEVFDYEPGRDVNDPIPYLVFEEENKSGR